MTLTLRVYALEEFKSLTIPLTYLTKDNEGQKHIYRHTESGDSTVGCGNDESTADKEGNSCSWYDSSPGACGSKDDIGFLASTQCCACGGGSPSARISELILSSTIAECSFSSSKIELVKDRSGSPIDEESGLGIVTYNSQDDILEIDRSIRGGIFEIFISMTSDCDDTVYYPLNIYIYRIMYEPTTILKQFAIDDGKSH
tara:strand:+ start:95 stop:694 length:600 start_codon:yes stop_codon:yes gene_type:complete